jgi:hypothetical protein
MPPRRAVLLALLATSALADGALAAGAGPSLTVLNPDDIRPGDTEQSIHIAGESLAESTTLVVDLTPLVDAGTDLSDASASIRASGGVDATATIDDHTRVRVRMNPTESSTDFRVHVRLRGLGTANATPGVLRYDATFDGRAVDSDPFRVNDPSIPEVSRVVEPTHLVVVERTTTQRMRLVLLDVPANETIVTVDLAALRRANASLRGATVTTEVALPDRGVTVRTAERRGTTVTLAVASTDARDRVAITLSVRGIDTRAATPTTDLRYPITATTSAGSMTVESEPFGLYRPGETPSPTPTPVEVRSEAPSQQPRTTGDGAGFGSGAWLAAVLISLVLARATRA